MLHITSRIHFYCLFLWTELETRKGKVWGMDCEVRHCWERQSFSRATAHARCQYWLRHPSQSPSWTHGTFQPNPQAFFTDRKRQIEWEGWKEEGEEGDNKIQAQGLMCSWKQKLRNSPVHHSRFSQKDFACHHTKCCRSELLVPEGKFTTWVKCLEPHAVKRESVAPRMRLLVD